MPTPMAARRIPCPTTLKRVDVRSERDTDPISRVRCISMKDFVDARRRGGAKDAREDPARAPGTGLAHESDTTDRIVAIA
jgi:hypothetical protein